MGLETFSFYFIMTKTLYMSNGNEYISTNIRQGKYNKGSMEQWYPSSTKWDKHTVAIIRIYGDREKFLLFRFMPKTLNLSDVK